MMIIALGVGIPIWTIICFVIGVSMERGSFSFVPGDGETKQQLRAKVAALREDLIRQTMKTEKWQQLAQEYQEVYPKPPRKFDYVIKEESDRVAQSMSH